MDLSEEQLRDVLKQKDHLSEKIEKHKEEIENLEKILEVLNLLLKQTSFKKASLMEIKAPTKQQNAIPITKSGDGAVIANAYVTPDQVSIVMENDIGLHLETPPFKSFFLDRIIGGMKLKDSQEAERGMLQKDSVIDCIINKRGTTIREIIIKNYRQKERVDEIINTASWSLSRMIENSRR